MNLSYAPINPSPPPPQQRRQQIQPSINRHFSNENTECNYLVMFFILGVFVLVINDQIK